MRLGREIRCGGDRIGSPDGRGVTARPGEIGLTTPSADTKLYDREVGMRMVAWAA